MPAKPSIPTIPLPRGWPSRVKSALLHVISSAQFAPAYARGWAANRPNSRIRLKSELERAHQEVAFFREELRIHKLRMAQLPPHRRPYYRPAERMAILQLKAARGWSLAQTAQEFLVTADTIRSWLKRVDEQGLVLGDWQFCSGYPGESATTRRAICAPAPRETCRHIRDASRHRHQRFVRACGREPLPNLDGVVTP